MPAFAPAPRFHGKPVYVEFDPSIQRAPVIFAEIRGVVRHTEDSNGTQHELLLRIHALVTEHGLVAHLVALSSEAIEFRIAFV